MKLSLLFCFLFLFLTVSCGSDDDDDSDTPVVPTPTSNEDDRENEDVVSKYTTIRLNANGFYNNLYEHNLRMDTGRRPLVVSGTFKSSTEFEANTEKSCSFQFNLTEGQADKLELLANNLKVCNSDKDGEEIVDFEENDLIYLTDRSGKETEAFKTYPGEFDMKYSWLCGGQKRFYSYVKTLVAPKVPENCPEGAVSKF